VSEFVDRCRAEWKRLGVPDEAANEMAADLETDLQEAQAEGVSIEEVLGRGAFDPAGFAASWASERGVVPRHPAGMPQPSRRTPVGAVLLTLAAILVLLVGLAVLSGRASTHVALQSQVVRPAGGGTVVLPSPRWFGPHPRLRVVPRVEGIPPTVAVVSVRRAVRPFGWLLLLLGAAGVIASVVYWSRHFAALRRA
jgi:hypothetical protein